MRKELQLGPQQDRNAVLRNQTFAHNILTFIKSPQEENVNSDTRGKCWKMAQQRREFIMRALGPEFKSPAPHKKLGVVIHAHNPSTLEGWRPKLVGVIGVSQPISKFNERPCLYRRRERVTIPRQPVISCPSQVPEQAHPKKRGCDRYDRDWPHWGQRLLDVTGIYVKPCMLCAGK